MSKPVYDVKVGTIEGAVWPTDYGYSITVRKPKRKKEGEKFIYVKEDGKQVYANTYSASDLDHMGAVLFQLRVWIINNPADVKDF